MLSVLSVLEKDKSIKSKHKNTVILITQQYELRKWNKYKTIKFNILGLYWTHYRRRINVKKKVKKKISRYDSDMVHGILSVGHSGKHDRRQTIVIIGVLGLRTNAVNKNNM